MPAHPRRGAEWLVRETSPGEVLTPETLGEEHRLVGRTAAEFVAREVDPALEALENKDWAVARTLVRRACELGLVGADVPERFGGVGLDKAAAVVVAEALGGPASFSMAFGGQANLTLLPILAFGTDAQRARYLPALLSGATIGAYCLSESGSGSDAQSVRTRAVRAADGSWLLSGEKMWITNGGFADLFLVFAKVDGEHFTAFLVERGFPGVTNGPEEHKMGLHGSSTTPIVLNDARVPAENVLGEIGRGHKIAFNVLNCGRLKLAATCTGAAKAAIAEAAAYANTRRQFGQPIASFGAIEDKLGAMAIRTCAVESALFRVAGVVDAVSVEHSEDPAAGIRALEEFAVEASLLKIAGSEMLDFVVDENVQIFGGNGFVREYPAERRYRDARVNRIFEGTNEINRLLVPGLLLKRFAQRGWSLDETGANQPAATDAEPAAATDPQLPGASVRDLKYASRQIFAAAVRAFGDALHTHQRVTMGVTDLLIATLLAESAVLRASGARTAAPPATAAGLRAAAAVIVNDAVAAAALTAREVLAALPAGSDSDRARAAAQPLFDAPLVNTIGLRQEVAALVTGARQYPF